MSFRDLIYIVWSNLNRMRVRVILTAFGVVIGTAAVLVLVSLGVGLQRSATEQIGDISDFTRINVIGESFERPVVMGPGVTQVRRVRRREGEGLTEKALRRIAEIEGVVAVTPVENVQGPAMLSYNRLRGHASIQGLEPSALELLGFKAASGTLRLRTGQMVVGAKVGEMFYDPLHPMVEPGKGEPLDLQGATLTLEVQRFSQDGQMASRQWRLKVVGVLEEAGESDYNVYLTLKEVEKINEWLNGRRVDRNREGYSRAVVKVASTRQVQEVKEQITDMGFGAFAMQDALRGVNTFFTILQAILGGIGGIALLVAAFGIANTLSMAIYERTREIGLMKALGARNRDVMSIFLAEAASIGLLGGVVGSLGGWGLSGVLNLFARSAILRAAGPGAADIGPSTIVYTPPWLIPTAILFATLVGLVSGVFPALRAATLDPIRALKYE